MFFEFCNRNKTVKELRKKMGFTAQELAFHLKMDTIEILRIDNLKLKEVSKPLKDKILPTLRGDSIDKHINLFG